MNGKKDKAERLLSYLRKVYRGKDSVRVPGDDWSAQLMRQINSVDISGNKIRIYDWNKPLWHFAVAASIALVAFTYFTANGGYSVDSQISSFILQDSDMFSMAEMLLFK